MRNDNLSIEDDILSLVDDFDGFLLDAYGVFWNGGTFYPGALDRLEALGKRGKVRVILSNATRRSEQCKATYGQHGMRQGVHYEELISSGEMLYFLLHAGRVKFSSNAEPKRFFPFGTVDYTVFQGTIYEPAPLDQADFIFVGIPQLAGGKNSTVLDPFLPILEELARSGLPVLNANPDHQAQEFDRESGEIHWYVRQGAISHFLEARGAEVVELGKPSREAFRFGLEELERRGVRERERIVMVGDTLETDILGGNQAGLETALCLTTGATAKKILRADEIWQEGLLRLFAEKKIYPKRLIRRL